MTGSGKYLALAPRVFLAKFFESQPRVWFDLVWKVDLPTAEQVGEEAAEQVAEREIGNIARCLRDIAAVLDSRDPESAVSIRAESALQMLEGIAR